MQAGLPASPGGSRRSAAVKTRRSAAQATRRSTGSAGAQGLDGENAVIRWSDTGKPTPPVCPGRRRPNDQRAGRRVLISPRRRAAHEHGNSARLTPVCDRREKQGRPPAGPHSRLQKTALGEADMPVAADDNVIDQAHIDERKRFLERTRQRFVGTRRFRKTSRVLVRRKGERPR